MVLVCDINLDDGNELIGFSSFRWWNYIPLSRGHSTRNSITEWWVRSLKGKVLYMLLRASLPVAFWWFVVVCVAYLLLIGCQPYLPWSIWRLMSVFLVWLWI